MATMTEAEFAPSSSVYHRVLYCADIFLTILDILHHSGGHAACASLARVCRAFTDPALRLVWRELKSLQPLWQVVLPSYPRPGTSLAIGAHMDQILLLQFYKYPSVWARFQLYARYIRSLEATSVYHVEARLIRDVIANHGGKTFLPSLRTLQWTEDGRWPGLLFSLIPSCLESLLIYYPRVPRGGAAEEGVLEQSALAIVSNLLQCRALRNLSTADTPIPPEHVRTLLSSLSLEVLSMHIAQGLDTTELTNAPTLLELQCTGTCADIASLVRSIRTPSLASLTLWICDPTTTTLSDFRQLVRGAAAPHSSTSLRRLSLCRSNFPQRRHARAGVAHEPTVASVTDVLAPVFALHRLTDFTITFSPRAFTLTCGDDDVQALARGLPALQELSLECYTSGQAWGLPSLRALRVLAAHCPRLTQLCIEALDVGKAEEQASVDAGANDSDPNAGPTSHGDQEAIPTKELPRVHPLQRLRVGRVKGLIKDPEKFAKLLDELFPNLKSVEWPQREIGHIFASWGDASRKLQRERRGEDAS
ncbi:hypothetical protein C8Q79DRAFT_28497 [Trametes meyenii]|nr:hypothetical protein C8Q79DRAFT_28497 [Trametes meyenii]